MARHAGAAVKQTIQLATLQNCTQIPKIDCEIVTYECTKTTLKPFKTKKKFGPDVQKIKKKENKFKNIFEGIKVFIIMVFVEVYRAKTRKYIDEPK